MQNPDIRKQIDEIDDQLTGLFARRMALCADEAAAAAAAGARVTRDPARDRETMYRATGIAGGAIEPYTRMYVTTLLSLGRTYEASLTAQDSAIAARVAEAIAATDDSFPTRAMVACQGVEGAYSQQACDKLFPAASILYFNRFEGVFRAVESGMCRYGILPIENSTAGSVTEVYDLIEKYSCSIVRATRLQISHCLMAKPGVKLDSVRKIVSHEQAISQCSDFLRAHPSIEVATFANTAAAAKYVAESDRDDLAAIGSELCAGLYGLDIISRTVQNSDHNYTRFICISKALEIYPGASRITFMSSLPHEPGSLATLISRFAAQGLNICKIESRPIPGRNFEFRFYLDIEADIRDERLLATLGQLEKEARFVFLGAYSEIG